MTYFKTEHRRALSVLLAVLLVFSMIAITTVMPVHAAVTGKVVTEDDITPGDYIDEDPGSTAPGGGAAAGSNTTTGTPSTSGGVTKVTTTVTASTSGTTANATITESVLNDAIKEAIDEAAKQGTAPRVEIKVNISAGATALNLTMPTSSLRTLANAANSTLAITSNILELTLDHTALVALVGAATGANITLQFAPVAASSLTAAQQAAVGTNTVIDLSLLSGGTAIHDFGGGTLTVALPYTLAAGQTASNLQVYYLEDDGSLTACPTSYSGGKVTFTTDHLSKYVIGTKADSSEFSDVSTSDWFYDAVMWAVKNGVTVGMGNGTFAPYGVCTRAQFVTFLHRAAGTPAPTSTTNKFTDVSATTHADYYNAILWATEQGITVGTGDGTTFSPSETVLRGQAVTFMSRYAAQAGIGTEPGTPSFTDVANEGAVAAYYDAIGWAVANGITKGNSTTENTFGPLDGCTRAEMVTFLYRLFTSASA